MNSKNNKNKYLIFVCLLLLFVGSFFIGDYVYAAEKGATNTLATFVANAVGSIFQFLIWILGGILYVLISILIWVAQYNDFINSEAVKNGWTITRDLANMFFIVILLIIAFATILRKEEYSYKKLLPKLLIMAVLINFSKTICGIFIDIAQVVMLTFVNGFKEMGGANLTSMLGISETMKISSDTSITVGALSIVGTYVLAFLYVLISVVVVLTMVAILVMRMVMLWIYIVLSPLAYLLAAFPAGQKYSQQWWGEFSKNVVIGPVLAFFIWLSFVAIPVDTTGEKIMDTSGVTTRDKTYDPNAGLSQAGSPDSMLKFIISIGMLVGGLMVSQQIGGAAGGIAGRGMAQLQRGRAFATSLPGRAGRAAVGAGTTLLSQGADHDTVAGTTSLRGRFRDTLGRVGGSRAIGLNTLATNALTGLRARQQSQEEQAQRYVSNIRDRRILARMANQGNLISATPWQAAIRDATRNRAPSEITNPATRDTVLSRMSQAQRQALSEHELEELGRLHQLGQITSLGQGDWLDYIQTNRGVRESVNRGGARAGGTFVLATDTHTYGGVNYGGVHFLGRNNTTGIDYDLNSAPAGGSQQSTARARGIFDMSTVAGPTPGLLNPNRYLDENDENERNAKKGDGNISVNRLARGQDNTIAVGFDQLPKGIFDDLKKSANLDKIKGVNLTDQSKIKEVSTHMADVLTKKISELQAGGGSAKQIELMSAAKTKFEGMANGSVKVDNLSMVNSSAEGYKSIKNVKKTKIHEELHGHGVDNEDDVKSMTENIMENKMYSQRKQVADSYNDRPASGGSDNGNDRNDALVESIENLMEKVGENTREVGSMANKFSDSVNKFGSATQKSSDEIAKNTKTVEKNTYATKQAAKDKKFI